MPACKVCGSWFAKIRNDEELCDRCEISLSRLSGYAVPVVRCNDCKHYDMGVCLKIYSDGNMHTEAWQSRRPEDFCSYGERKDDTDG